MFKTNKINRIGQRSALLFCAMYYMGMAEAEAEALKTDIPANINIPSQPLGTALKQFATQTGKNIIFDKTIVNGKTAPPVKGNYGEMDALKRVLEDSGLEAVQEDGTIVIRTARPAVQKKAESLELDKVEVRAKRFYEIGPLPGLGLTKEQIPGNVQSISAKEIKEAHSLSITDLMNRKLQSVTVNDYQGNPFQMDVQYRGFTAGPQIGTPQGLSVFFDGIRVNEPFGDVVNWDMIPMNALSSVDVFPGSNPIFGLGTLGGAFSVKTKDGFNNAGTDATILTGSYGRKYLQGEAGWNNGTVALFGAGNFFLEDGWRDNSPSKVNQFFGKASYRGDKLDINLSTLLVGNDLTGNGVVPTNFYEQDRNSVFTSPDETKNRLSQFQLSGSYFVNDAFTITGQVYRRNSRRSQKNADVYTDYRGQALSQNLNGLEFTCLFDSTGQAAEYGLSDYVVINVPNASDLSSSPFLNELFNNGNVDLSLLDAGAFNQTLTNTPEGSAYLALAQSNLAYWGNAGPLVRANIPAPNFFIPDPSGNFNSVQFTGQVFQNEFAVDGSGTGFGYNIFGALAHSYFYTNNGNTLNLVAFKQARNGTDCLANQASQQLGSYYNPLIGPRGVETIDGVSNGGSGVVAGIPTAVINNNNINQKIDGASIQFNWNLEKHKFMVGASIDNAYAEYNNSQRLGFFDSRRNGRADPDRALDMFKAADFDIPNNNFDGNSITKSVYLSETWTPIESFHMTGALRYNATQVNSTLVARDFGQSEISLSRYLNDPALFAFCSQNGTCPGTGYTNASPLFFTLPAEHEKFSYYSLNPSLGATWQAKENINLYANWAQGTRTPSVVELGCALDKTPTRFGIAPDGSTIFMPRSVALGRSCQLPSGLSGDPYLPQVRAETFDLGARGRWGDSLQWNLGYYRTELKNDIYMVTYFGNQNFFDSIGKTRRQGIEMGLSGEVGKARFGLNYALTDAKFRSTFVTGGDANSSATTPILIAGTGESTSGEITVRPGDRIPGVPLHNLNANFSYDITKDWTVSLGAVLHSWSYLRGNENNEHRPGVARPVIIPIYNSNGIFQRYDTVYRQPSTNPGKIPGYTVFNFQTSYKLSKEWTATMLVNNIFDKEYFSAGRLGVNPFSPSINGAIGPDGYNHNSGDWLSTNFVAPGAPRGVWFSLNWHFVPD